MSLGVHRLRQERDETVTRTQYNGGQVLLTITEFEIPEGTFRESLLPSILGDDIPHVHHHQYLDGHGPNTSYRFSHDFVIDGWDEFNS